ncbi:hypothetical protein MCOR27_001933 [Pyricularia oryzae]|uniref:Uncharacterized protein n=1 Tax=Pyricularia grisea TaxID=148305 RepID=A0ABQ8NRY0_PYRGI|nr:hypothetical protein MCOR01_004035 [Pyricularia oryzae]KAI6300665.1 hypothetical protein MCOR33_003695 [Pyricularia grisea]KAI6263653.1 hypothetical protein MCOR19_000288 [Pyricularia oryzae]KAI6264773.1 hypothetical protein MCOR26_011128 [Pyricularia oryzae]KAI6286174.1 hypothetical protein MCOR27_001933 [Pyricularia oryzae]
MNFKTVSALIALAAIQANATQFYMVKLYEDPNPEPIGMIVGQEGGSHGILFPRKDWGVTNRYYYPIVIQDGKALRWWSSSEAAGPPDPPYRLETESIPEALAEDLAPTMRHGPPPPVARPKKKAVWKPSSWL